MPGLNCMRARPFEASSNCAAVFHGSGLLYHQPCRTLANADSMNCGGT